MSGEALHLENGLFQARRLNTSTSARGLGFGYAAGTTAGSFDVRFDDIVVRKYVANEPAVVLEQSADVTVTVALLPHMTFGVGGVPSGVDCGVGTISTVPTSATSMNMRSLSTAANAIACQSLAISTNAAAGYTLRMEASGPLASGPFSIPGHAGTNETPTAFPNPGIESVGYSTNADLSGPSDRFLNPIRKWAGLTDASGEVAYASAASSGSAIVAYQVGISSGTPAGIYSTTVIYTAIPLF